MSKSYLGSGLQSADRRDARRWLTEVADLLSETRCSQRRAWAQEAFRNAALAEEQESDFIARICGRSPGLILGLTNGFGPNDVGSDRIIDTALLDQAQAPLRLLQEDFLSITDKDADLASRALLACRWHLERPYLAWVDATLLVSSRKRRVFAAARSALTQQRTKLAEQQCGSEPIWSPEGQEEKEEALDWEDSQIELAEDFRTVHLEDLVQYWNLEFTGAWKPKKVYVGTRPADGHTKLARESAIDVWHFLVKLFEFDSQGRGGKSELRERANEALELLLELSWPRPSSSKAAFDAHDLVGYRPDKREPPWALAQILHGAGYRDSFRRPRPPRPGGPVTVPLLRPRRRRKPPR